MARPAMKVPIPPIFWDDFEGCDLAKWAKTWSPTCSTDQNHTVGGAYSCKILGTTDYAYLVKTFTPQLSGYVVTFWLYDDATQTGAKRVCIVAVDDGVTMCLMGVDTYFSTTKYIYRVGATYYVSSIARTTGWHVIKFYFLDGLTVQGTFDGTQLFSATEPDTFNTITIGNAWVDKTGIDYVDDVDVRLP